MNTRDTAARVYGVSRCAKIQYRTRTRVTRFGNTAGFPVPVLNPTEEDDDEATTLAASEHTDVEDNIGQSRMQTPDIEHPASPVDSMC